MSGEGKKIGLDLLYPVGTVILYGDLPGYMPGEWEAKQKHTWTLKLPDGTEQLVTEYLWERVR